MDKTEFIRRYGELKQQINLLKKEYIESNITFPVGTKVKVGCFRIPYQQSLRLWHMGKQSLGGSQ